jgi:hypothetical protein
MRKVALVASMLISVNACSPGEPPVPDSSVDASATAAVAEESAHSLTVTEDTYAHAETARNFRNWVNLGADKQLVHMRELPPRGREAPTVQMNDDTLYSIAIVEVVDGNVRFSIPDVDVYMAVQAVTEGGHGQQYVVDAGEYDLPVETPFAFLIYRTGMEKGLEASRHAQDQINSGALNFGTYELPDYEFEEVEAWTSRLKYFTSLTAYDSDRYLIDGVRNVNSHSWDTNDDGSITVSFNCGDEALNNIDTNGQDFSFTMRYYGVTQTVVDGDIAPEMTVQ